MNVRQKRLAQIKSEREPQIKFARRRLGHDEKNTAGRKRLAWH